MGSKKTDSINSGNESYMYRGVHEMGLLIVHSLSIHPSAHNQLSERFLGNQLYVSTQKLP